MLLEVKHFKTKCLVLFFIMLLVLHLLRCKLQKKRDAQNCDTFSTYTQNASLLIIILKIKVAVAWYIYL